jgi:anti-sigma regulatory factor (Ser/Thr protein kinase)
MSVAVAAKPIVRASLGMCVRPLPGERSAGDACAAIDWSRGVVAAIVDGLGHGPNAAVAADAFIASVREAPELPLDEMFARAHRALVKTRGAVAAVARFDEIDGRVELAGLGNIALTFARSAERRGDHPVVVPGVLGSAYRSVRPHALPFASGDILVMCTDGVRSRFDFTSVRQLDVRDGAEAIVRAHAKSTDDACCVFVRGVADGGQRATLAPPRWGRGERTLPIRMSGDAECAAHEARTFTRDAGFDPRAQWEVSIATSELATNMLKHAGGGEIHVRLVRDPDEAVVVEAIDRGRGIPDVAMAMHDGFSEGRVLAADRVRHEREGLGVGLGSVQRLMDRVAIESDARRGTKVVAWKLRAKGR